MKWKPLSREEVSVCLKAEPEFLPIEGNAMASGDDAFDREVEQGILRRIDQGDVWAWAMVTVTVSWGPFSASDHLGACSYADEDNFRQPGGYFDDMVDQALDELNRNVWEAYTIVRDRELAA